MRILSEPSLKCFLEDLRLATRFLRSQLPKDIHFFSTESFYFYLRMAYPEKTTEIQGLMAVLEPYVPLILSESTLFSLFDAYVTNDIAQLLVLQDALVTRSKLLFISSAIDADDDGWQNVMDICCTIRRQM